MTELVGVHQRRHRLTLLAILGSGITAAVAVSSWRHWQALQPITDRQTADRLSRRTGISSIEVDDAHPSS